MAHELRGGKERRAHERVWIERSVRVVVDLPSGLAALHGRMMDLSEGGCALLLDRCVVPDCVGRLRITIGTSLIWMPIVTRWVKSSDLGWTVGCQFDRPTPEKLLLVQRLIRQARRDSA